jgi:hypothetical protein
MSRGVYQTRLEKDDSLGCFMEQWTFGVRGGKGKYNRWDTTLNWG